MIKNNIKIKKDYENLLLQYNGLENTCNILNNKIKVMKSINIFYKKKILRNIIISKSITDSKNKLIENLKENISNLEKEISCLLNENNKIQIECDNVKNLYYGMKISNENKYNNFQHQLELIENAIQYKTNCFENILIEKDKKYNELITLYNSLIDEYETFKNKQVSSLQKL